MSALPPPSPSETPAQPPQGRHRPVREFVVERGALWIGGLILLAVAGVVFFVSNGGGSKGAPENDAFRSFFNDHRATVCPVYIEVKNTLGLEAAENTALELLEETYAGTWQEALGTEALRMFDSCESSSDDQTTSDEQASAANPNPSSTTAPVETEPPTLEPTTTEPVEEPSITASTSIPTTAPTPPMETFADLAAAADEVLGPLEMADGTRFAVLAHHAEKNIALTDGSVILAVEGPNGWDVRQEIVPEASPGGLSAPADLDGDGQREIQVSFAFGANGYFDLLYRVEADGPRLAEVPFAEEELGDPMGDYEITSVAEGAVTTSVESCDPSCADGGDYEISWNYDAEQQRLIPLDPSNRVAQFIVANATADDGTPFTSAECAAGEYNGSESMVYQCTATTQAGRLHYVTVNEHYTSGDLYITATLDAADGVTPRPTTCPDYVEDDEIPIGLCAHGVNVGYIQRGLIQWGYTLDADGSYGLATETAVRYFQSMEGLPVTGVVDETTWRALGPWIPE